MALLDGFDSYMFYELLATFFHTSVEQIYWSLAVAGLVATVIIFVVYYLIVRKNK